MPPRAATTERSPNRGEGDAGDSLTFLPTAALVRKRLAESPDPLRRFTTFTDFVGSAYAVLGDGKPWLGDLSRDRAVGKLIAARAAADPAGRFAAAVAKPGLREALLRTLADLKHAGAEPGDLSESDAAAPFLKADDDQGLLPLFAPDPPAGAGADNTFGDLAAIYGQVRATVRDEDDHIWLVAAALENGADLPPVLAGVRAVRIEDTDVLTAGQRTLLAALVGRGIGLTYMCPLTATVAARLPLMAEQTAWLDALARKHRGRVKAVYPDEPAEPAEPAKPGDLARLRRSLFGWEPPAPSRDGRVRLIRAADPVAEADAVARDIRRRLREDRSLRPADIAVALGDSETYRPLLLERFARAGLPCFSRRGEALAAQPLYRYLGKVFGLPLTGFAGRAVISVLQNSYSRFRRKATVGDKTFTVDGNTLELLFAELGYTGTGETLARRLERRAVDVELEKQELRDRRTDGADAAETDAHIARLDEGLARTRASVAEMERHFGPLRRLAETTDARKFAELAAEAIDIYAGHGSGEFSDRDAKTLALIRRAVVDQAAEWPADEPISLSAWLEEIDALAARRALINVGDPDGVQLVTVQELSGFRYAVVYVPGLLHGGFPRGETVQPFLPRRRRGAVSEALRRRGLPPLTGPDHGTELDRVLFARAVNAAERELVLSVPVTPETMEDHPPGEFFADSEFLFRPDPDRPTTLPDRSHPLREPVAMFADAANATDLHARTALALFEPAGSALPGTSAGAVYAKLTAAEPDSVSQWLRAAAVQRARSEAIYTQKPHPYSGDFAAAGELIRAAFRHEGGELIVRGRELETFGTCAFRFVVEAVLKLRPLARPDDDVDALARGRLVHRVLERFYRDPARRRRPPDPREHAPVLQELAADEMRRFRAGGSAGAADHVNTVAAQLAQRLTNFLDADRTYRQEEGSRPELLEYALDGVPVTAGAARLRVKGRIDRLDVAADGSAVIIDYKNSSLEADARRFELGTLVQLGLYALALESEDVEKLAKAGWTGGAPGSPRGTYYALRRRKGQVVQPMKVFDDDGWRRRMRMHLARYAAALAAGAFPVHPVDEGCRYCAWAGVCRRPEDVPLRPPEADDAGPALDD